MPRAKSNHLVLVVDDNKHMARCLAEMIEILGVNCHTAYEGEQAMEMLKLHDYTLVVADSNMPGISGFSLLKHIKQNHERTKVAIMSLRDSESTQNIVAKGRADFYLPKPFKTEDIEKLLNEAF
jgi:CheY-like chemotaxis protein